MALLAGAVYSTNQNASQEAEEPPAESGTIYRVPPEGTSSGKPYIGRHNKSTPQKTRKSKDGRDRTKPEVVDTYDASKPMDGRIKEQKHIESEGGVRKTG